MATFKKLNWLGLFSSVFSFFFFSFILYLPGHLTGPFWSAFKLCYSLLIGSMIFWSFSGESCDYIIKVARSTTSSLFYWFSKLMPLVYVVILIFFAFKYPRPTDQDLDLMVQHHGDAITVSLAALLILQIASFLFCRNHFKIIGDQMILIDDRIYYSGESATLHPWLSYKIEKVPELLEVGPIKLQMQCSDGIFNVTFNDNFRIDIKGFKEENVRTLDLKEEKRKLRQLCFDNITKFAKDKSLGQLVSLCDSCSYAIFISQSALLGETHYET